MSIGVNQLRLTHSEHDLVNRMYETNTGETGAIANVLADQQGEPYATAITSDAQW